MSTEPVSTQTQFGERLSDQLTDVASGAPDQLGVTVEELRRRGARRRRTRIVVASAAVLLVAGGTAGGVLAAAPGGGAAGAGNDGMHVGAPPATAAPSAETSTAASSGGTAGSVIEPASAIDTGEAVGGGTLTFWFAVRDERFLQAVGQRGPDGLLALAGVTNDPDVTGPGPGDAGFHAGWEFGSGQDRFVTGYVVGDVTTVTLTVDGTLRTAKTAAWGADPAVHVWWLRVPEVPGTPWQRVQVGDLTALDAAGRVVASRSDGGVAVG